MNVMARHVWLALAVGLVALAVPVAAGQAAATPPAVQATQELAVLLESHEARQRPDSASPSVGWVEPTRPITGLRTVLPVLGHATGPAGVAWLRVRLPGRPNGHTGWITTRATRLEMTSWQLVVDLSSRRVLAYSDGRLLNSYSAVVGKPSTPTPLGNYFVEEAVDLPSGAPGAPYALALSARSYVLQEFAGGPGQIALHGVDNIGGVLGTAVSHGCIRLDTVAIRWLAAHIGPGTPVTIRR